MKPEDQFKIILVTFHDLNQDYTVSMKALDWQQAQYAVKLNSNNNRISN